jgi:hypothetical protein
MNFFSREFTSNVFIVKMFKGSAAAKKGLKKGDQILEVSLIFPAFHSYILYTTYFLLHYVYVCNLLSIQFCESRLINSGSGIRF